MRGTSSILKAISISEGDFICDIVFLGGLGAEPPNFFGDFRCIFRIWLQFLYVKLLFRGVWGAKPPRKFFVILGAFSQFFVIFSYRFESLNFVSV